MEAKIRRWELVEAIFIILVGSVLHFVFAWSGYWPPMAVIAPVNESVWEHLKLAFWPALAFALIEYAALRERANNYWVAKGVALFSMPALIVALFYAYTAVAGDNVLAVDIVVFVVSVAVGQWISYRILLARKARGLVGGLALVALVTMVAAFSLLSYYPPRLPLFRDSVTGQHGLLDADPVSH
jgi:hypothetical protein